MKKTILIAMLLLAGSSAVIAQSLQTFRKTIIFHHAEDWCGSCGDWGWALKDSLIRIEMTDPEFRAYNVACYGSSAFNMNSPLTNDLAANAMPVVIAIPTVLVDNKEVDVFNDFDWNADFDSTGDLVEPAVDSVSDVVKLETSTPAVAAIGFSKTIKNTDSLIIMTRVKFLSAASGEYRVAVYVVEDSVYAMQNGNIGSFSDYHRVVLRDVVQNTVWGQTLTSTSVAANAEFYNYFRMKMPSSWNKNRLKVLAIVYKKNASTGNYEVENVTDRASLEPANVGGVEAEKEIGVYPNPVRDRIYVTSLANVKGAEVVLTDVQGKVVPVETIVKGEELVIKLRGAVRDGAYLLRVKDGKRAIVKEVSVGGR